MRHTILMTIPHALQHLPTQIPRIILRITLILANPVKQIPSAHELHDEEVTFPFLEEVDEGTNVGVAEGGEDEDLVVDGGVVGGGEVFAEDAFDGYFFVGGAVGAAADCGEGAGFELCWGWGIQKMMGGGVEYCCVRLL